MFVRQLTGRMAGEIVEMRADAAQACLAMGSVAAVTDEEMAAAGLAPPPAPVPDTVPLMTPGYDTVVRPDGLGHDLYLVPILRAEGGAITSEPVNAAPLPNLAAARDAAADHAKATAKAAARAAAKAAKAAG